MREIGINIVLILYVCISCFILGIAMLFPFLARYENFPIWTAWIIYPVTILIMSSQNKMTLYFINKISTHPKDLHHEK